MNTPLITICVINYNNSKFLADLLESIKNQTYQNIEIVFCDDKSTDNSIDIFKHSIKSFPKSFKVNFIRRDKNSGGAIVPIFDALHASSGDYICILDGDDFVHPQFIEILFELISSGNYDIASVNNGCFRSISEIEIKQFSHDDIKEYPVSIHNTRDVIPRLFMDTDIDIPFERWHRLYSKDVISRLCNMPIKLFNTNGDSDISLATFMESTSMIYANIPLHFWRINADSVTHKSRLGFIEKFAYSGLGLMVEYYTNKDKRNYFLEKLYVSRQLKVIAWMFETAREEMLPFKEYRRLHTTYVTSENYRDIATLLITPASTVSNKIFREFFRYSPYLYYRQRD